jgi:uncharacterized membrane protein YhaH (DUF805 family)
MSPERAGTRKHSTRTQQGQAIVMNAIEAVRTCLTKYAAFRGRASLSEFWWFQSFCAVIFVVAGVADKLEWPNAEIGFFEPIAVVVLLLPLASAGVRRLHDAGFTGWWLLIGAAPLVGAFTLLVLFALKGDSWPNTYGDPPERAVVETSLPWT